MSNTTVNDADLVTAYRAGDTAAFAAIYDRYGAALYDTAAVMVRRREDAADVTQDVFVIASERMEQLRDPARLKPWLFAILRNEVYRRSGANRRLVVTDFTSPTAEMQLPSESSGEADAAEYEELATLVRAAAAGLDERDQLILELSVRQGLTGDDLADALGVSAQQSYSLLHRMRQRTERSLGAYCVARKGRNVCSTLDGILHDWDGEFSVLVRKRVARHVEQCEVCEHSRRKFVPFVLYGAAPIFAAPADLRDRVLAATGTGGPPPAYGFSAPGGFPAIIRYGRRLAFWMTFGVIAVLLVSGTTAFVWAGSGDTNGDADDPAALIADSTTTVRARTSSTLPPPSATTTVAVGNSGSTTSTSPSAASSITTSLPPTTVTIVPASTVIVTTVVPTTVVPITAIVTATTIPTATTTAAAATTTVPAVIPTTTAAAATTTLPVTTTTTTTTTTTVPGALALSSGTIDFGTTLNQAVLTLSNPGGQPVSWTTGGIPPAFRGTASPFSSTPRSGTLEPGASIKVTFSIDRTWPTEGPIKGAAIRFFSAGDATEVALVAEIARPPALRVIGDPGPIVCQKTAQGLFWEADVADESLPLAVVVDVRYPDGVTRTAVMGEKAPSWFGGLNGDGDGDGLVDFGVFSWTVRATDAFGNSSRITGQTSVGIDSSHC